MDEFLEVHRETAEDLLDEALPFLLAGKLSYAGLLTFCQNFRIKGLVDLLLDAEPVGLHRNLYYSGRAFLSGLRAMAPKDVVVSRAVPLFDALACNDWSTAAGISQTLRVDWKQEIEYEDDYEYIRLICQCVAGVDRADYPDRMKRFEVLAVDEDPRVLILNAIEQHDSDGFNEGLEALSLKYERNYRMLVERGALSDEAAATLPYFCAEALGLLRLAEQAGLRTLTNYPLLPALAVGSIGATQFSAEGWRQPRTR